MKADNNKFLRIARSQNIHNLKPKQITDRINNKEFLYIDFSDLSTSMHSIFPGQSISIMKHSKPNENELDEETQIIGNEHISGLNRLSPNTYELIKYLADNRIRSEKFQRIDDMVRKRIRHLKQKRQKVKSKDHSSHITEGRYRIPRDNGNQSEIANQSMSKSHRYQLKQKQHKFMNGRQLEQYLQSFNLNKIKEQIEVEQKCLQRSISCAGEYKKMNLKLNNKQLKLPVINTSRKFDHNRKS